MATYQARPIKRPRRTRTQVQQLEEQIYTALRNDRPASVRNVFYQMTNPRLPEPVEKSERGYCQVQDRIVKMRRAGVIPYHWVTDATRRGYHTAIYRNAAEALRNWQGMYRGDVWAGAGCYVEVWVESRSVAGMIEQTCADLAVSLYPAGGFTSLTLAYQAAEVINDITGRGEIPANVLYIGDYDPAGVLIDRKVEDELRVHLDPAVDLSFYRIAVTPEQILEMDLPTKPRKETERRAAHIERTVEAEAMPAGTMRDLLRGWVEEFLPAGALEAAKAAEENERRLIMWAADQMERAS